MPKQPTGDIIVLLPGILGSELHDEQGRQVWSLRGPGMLRGLFTLGNSLTRLLLKADDLTGDVASDGIRAVGMIQDLVLLPGFWRMDGYTQLSKVLRSSLTVTPGENFFEFPYDWRRDNRVHARRLRAESGEWLKRWRQRSGNPDAKLILIAHSMGGLISRYFLEVEGGWKDSRALITMGTPYRGAVEPLNRLVNGVDVGLGPFSPDFRGLAQSFPSCYQLSANWKAFNPGDGQWVRPFDALHLLPGLDPTLAAGARSFHDEIADAVRRNRADPAWEQHGYAVYPVVGTRQPTLQSCSARPGGMDVSHLHRGVEMDGDGSVSQGSATPEEFPVSAQRMFAAATHGALQGSEAVLHQILGVIDQLRLQDQLAAFPEPESLIGLSLRMTDHLLPGQPLDFEVVPDEVPEGGLTARLVDASTGRELGAQRVEAVEGEPVRFTFPPPPPGVYRVSVRGQEGSWVSEVSDGFVAFGEAVEAGEEPRAAVFVHSGTEPAPAKSGALELFLADEEGAPLLESLPRAAVAKTDGLREQPESFTNPGASPNDLREQGWAVIVPEASGPERLEAIRPLIDKRARDQQAEVKVLRAPPDLDPLQTLKWVAAELARPDVDLRSVPLYLLLLGSPSELSLAMQQTLSTSSLVGRLDLDRLEDYAAYADKVVAFEQATPQVQRPRALFWSVLDGSKATSIGHEGLVAPTLADVRASLQAGEHGYGAGTVEAMHVAPGMPDASGFLEVAAREEPTVLLSMSHGTGPSRRGWRSADHQRALQGSISLGQGKQLTAEHVAGQTFLPGGLWMFFACYGAGTPGRSAYQHWLRRLSDEGKYAGKVEDVLAGLPQGEGRPFVAALPKAALANPRGPLAVVGHLDLAWSYAFQDLDQPGVSRHKRFLATLRQMYEGDRVGVALDPLFSVRDSLERWVVSAQDMAEAGDLTREAMVDGHRWMMRQDLDGYVILGDPAARVALGMPGAVPARKVPEVQGVASAMERAIWELIEGHESPRGIAARHGMEHHALLEAFSRYVKAGRGGI
jgi:hypothetical protein